MKRFGYQRIAIASTLTLMVIASITIVSISRQPTYYEGISSDFHSRTVPTLNYSTNHIAIGWYSTCLPTLPDVPIASGFPERQGNKLIIYNSQNPKKVDAILKLNSDKTITCESLPAEPYLAGTVFVKEPRRHQYSPLEIFWLNLINR